MRSFSRLPAFVALNALLLAFCLIKSCSAQLASHADAHSNSFTLKAPGLQQSFTRYFGGKGANLLQSSATTTTAPLQAQQLQRSQQQAQQPFRGQLQSSHRERASTQQTQQSDYQSQYHQYMQSVRQLQQLQQELEQQRQQVQQELEMQRQQAQPHQYGAMTLSAYYAMQQQQQQQAQQQQQQQQFLAQQQYQQQLLEQLYAQPQLGSGRHGSSYNLPSSNAYSQANDRQNQQSWSTLPQYTSALEQQTQQIRNQQLGQLQDLWRNGAYTNLNSSPGTTVNAATMAHSAGFTDMPPMHAAHYSPASNVSRVRYSSGNLNYNF